MGRTFRDDRALAGALGLVLMLAVMVTLYASAVRNDIPVYGEDAERAWDHEIASTFRQLGRATGQAIAEGAPVSATLPAPPEPKAIDVPLMGRTEPLQPSGSVSFRPDCASFTATHVLGDGTRVEDLTNGARGCIGFRATPVYSRAFGYDMEFGGVVRVQGNRSVVIAGPPVELQASSPNEHRVSIALPGLRGYASSISNDASNVGVNLIPGPSAREVERAANAREATWVLETAHPAAWKTWFGTQLGQSGLVASRANPGPGESGADYTLSCMPIDCTVGPSGRGTVTLALHGPRTDAADLKLSFTYGLYDVNLH